MKKFMIFLLLLVGITSLAGCGTKKKAGEITVWWPGGTDSEAAINAAKAQYEIDNPGITIRVVPQQTTNFAMDYTMSLMGNDYPDLVYVDHVFVQQLAALGYIANLSDAGFDNEKSKFIDSLWGPNTYVGDLYAVPFSANVLATVYNKTLISTVLGREMTQDDVPTTFTELEAISAKIIAYNTANNLKGDDAYIPYTIPAGNNSQSFSAMAFISLASRSGSTIMSSDLRTMNLEAAGCVNAATKIYEFGQKGYSTSSFEEGKFEQGRVAFIEMGPWKMREYERIGETNRIDFGYAPIIKMTETGNNNSALGLFSLVVTEQSINKEITIEFAKYLGTNDELLLLHNKGQNLMPTTKTSLADEFYDTKVWPIYKEQLNHIIERPGSPEWATIEKTIAEFVTALLDGSREPEYLEDLNYVIQIALDEFYSNL